jgi:hypothetical protein
MAYQWYLKNQPLPLATDLTFIVSSVSLANAGSYYLVASNPYGTATSSLAYVAVILPPSVIAISQQPQSQTVNAGGSVSFHVAATGAGPFTYQWFKNGIPINGATSSTHAIPMVTPNDAGAYSAIVWNGVGSAVSQAATLAVTIVPGLTIPLAVNCSNAVWTTCTNSPWFPQTAVTADGDGAAQSGPVGDSQTSWLQATVQGKGTLQFTWRVSSEVHDYLRFYADGVSEGAISGTTTWQTVSLTLTNTGDHVLLWQYVKSKSGTGGADAGWLDQVSWSPVTATLSAVASPIGSGVIAGCGTFPVGSSNTLVALPTLGWRFEQWENGATTPQRVVVVPDGGLTCTATFVQAAISIAEAVNTTNLLWSTGGDAQWAGMAIASAYDGTNAAQSGAIGDLQSSWVQTTVTGPGTLSFWWRVSSEEDCDYLDFDTDGETRYWISGETEWQQRTIRLTAGQHTVQWTYWKDESISVGQDAGWLDQVVWSPDVQPLSGFALWANQKGATCPAASFFAEDRDCDGVFNGFEYAFGTNWVPGEAMLQIRTVNGQIVVETPCQDTTTLPYVELTVKACTNLTTDAAAWTLPVNPATNCAGKPCNRSWFEPQGIPQSAFFRLETKLK